MDIVQIQVDRAFFLEKRLIPMTAIEKYCSRYLKKQVRCDTAWELAEVKVPVSYKLLGYAVCFSMLGYNHYRLFYCRGMMEKTRVLVLYALFASQIYVLPADVVKVEKPLQDNNTVKFELCKVQLCEWLREFRYRVGHRNYLLAEADQRISYDRGKIKCLTFRKMSSNTIVKGELKKLTL